MSAFVPSQTLDEANKRLADYAHRWSQDWWRERWNKLPASQKARLRISQDMKPFGDDVRVPFGEND